MRMELGKLNFQKEKKERMRKSVNFALLFWLQVTRNLLSISISILPVYFLYMSQFQVMTSVSVSNFNLNHPAFFWISLSHLAIFAIAILVDLDGLNFFFLIPTNVDKILEDISFLELIKIFPILEVWCFFSFLTFFFF